MICPKRWSVFPRKPRRLVLRHNNCFSTLEFSNALRFVGNLQSKTSQFASDVSPKLQTISNPPAPCQAHFYTTFVHFIENYFICPKIPLINSFIIRCYPKLSELVSVFLLAQYLFFQNVD